MATSRYLLRSKLLHSQSSQTLTTLRSLSTSHHNDHKNNHQFLSPSDYIDSWKPPKNPREAESKLSQLRREYAKKVKEVRKEYIYEVEVQRQEKLRKVEAKREALRIANEERRAAKAVEKKAKAAEREVAEQEFRQTLLKEREAKLEYWRMREKVIGEKKKDKNELLRRQSSMWVDESELESKVLEAIVDTNQL